MDDMQMRLEDFRARQWVAEWITCANEILQGSSVDNFITATAGLYFKLIEFETQPVKFELSPQDIEALKAADTMGLLITAASETEAIAMMQDALKSFCDRLNWDMTPDGRHQLENTLGAIWKPQKESFHFVSRETLLEAVRNAANDTLNYTKTAGNLSMMIRPAPENQMQPSLEEFRTALMARLMPTPPSP